MKKQGKEGLGPGSCHPWLSISPKHNENDGRQPQNHKHVYVPLVHVVVVVLCLGVLVVGHPVGNHLVREMSTAMRDGSKYYLPWEADLLAVVRGPTCVNKLMCGCVVVV